MAIGRVAGPLLYSDLDRQGVDLQFSTDNKPLFYMDFANFRAAINSDTLNTTATFTVNGNSLLGNVKIDQTTISSSSDLTLAAANNIHIGGINQLKITGGASNYIMSTDGSGNLSWQNLNDLANELDLSASNIHLGTPTDNSVVDEGAYRYWTPTTTVADAVDNLNQVMLNVYRDTYVGQADFTANVVAGPSPLTVAFAANTVGNPTSYLWEFGDGSAPSTERNPTHTYNNDLGGHYSVYFKASNPAGTKSAVGRLGDGALAQGSYADIIKTEYITLYTPLPISTFTLSDVSIDSGQTVQLTNTSHYSSSYVVHWGDGSNSVIPSDFVAGGVSGGPISHTYTNDGGDTLYSVTLSAHSDTAGPEGVTVSSTPISVRVYSAHTPTFTATPVTGNNQHSTVPNGLVTNFTNTTSTLPGITSIFPANMFRWNWGDNTHTDVLIGSGAAGDINEVISHPFVLSDPKVEQTFLVTLELFTGHSTQPFTSIVKAIVVTPAPTAIFTGEFSTISDRIGDTSQTGYLFTDLLGRNRNLATFSNQSINADTYTWNLGDGKIVGPMADSDTGGPVGPMLTNLYVTQGQFSVSLLAHGASSLTADDDTLLKSDYLTVLAPPPPPASLGTKSILITSVGNNPLLAANATKNTVASMPAAGTAIGRITTAPKIETNVITNAYNALPGEIFAVINGIAESPIQLTGENKTGPYGSLEITADLDAHNIMPATYPSSFYNVFSGKISKANDSVPVGVDSFQVSHSSTGSTNVLTFVKDDVISPPVLNASLVTATTTSLGSLRYISGVPYFSGSGEIAINGITAASWIGQTYLGSLAPMSVTANSVTEGAGPIILTQTKTYSELDLPENSYLLDGIPIANTGKTASNAYTLGPIPISINSAVAACGTIALQLQNVNGSSAVLPIPVNLNVYSIPVVGLDETNIPVSVNLGGSYDDNGKRVLIANASGPTPTLSSTVNYYTSSTFTGPVSIAGTDEAIVRFGTLGHNLVDYSTYLPPGPDCSSREGTQYFRFAFRRSQVANFTITFSGKVSGLMIAAPGTQIDATSTKNKWLDATLVYAGAGVPGENTLAGGNGSNGCAKTAGDVVPTGQLVSSRSCVLTLGSANSSDATGNEILVSIALNAGDSITAISIS